MHFKLGLYRNSAPAPAPAEFRPIYKSGSGSGSGQNLAGFGRIFRILVEYITRSIYKRKELARRPCALRRERVGRPRGRSDAD